MCNDSKYSTVSMAPRGAPADFLDNYNDIRGRVYL